MIVVMHDDSIWSAYTGSISFLPCYSIRINQNLSISKQQHCLMASQLFMEKSEPAKQLVNAPSTFPPAEQGKDTNQTDKSQPLTSAPMQANIEQSPYQQQPPYQSYPYQQAWGYQQWPFPHNLHPYQHPYGFQPQRGHGDRGHYHYGKHGHGWGRHHERRGHHEDRGWQHEGRGNQEWRNNARRQEQGQYDAQQQHSQYYGFPPNQQPMMHGYYPNQAPQHVQPPPPTHYMPPQHHPPQFWPPCWQGERRGKRGRRGGCGKGRRGRSSSHSRSNSSSSSSSSESKQKKGAQNTKKAESIRYQQQISGNYKNQMKNFFQSRNVNEKQEGKIIELLKRNYPAFDAPIPLLLQCVQFAQKEKLLFRMSYVKVMKVLIRCGLDLSQAIPKLLRIQEHKLRKFQADEQFAQKYGKQAQTPLLEVNELILMQADTRPTLFLVDGNNILPTNKHLRRYFQSRRPLDRVLGQMRARWYISHCFQPGQVVLFFDERFQDAEYQLAQQCTFPDEHEQLRASQIQVVYGEESKADDKIVQRLKEVSQGKEKAEVVLVSADRELGMRCQQIRPVLHTSGKYFFKFCKYVLSRKYKGDKMLKRMARGINCYEEENSRVLK